MSRHYRHGSNEPLSPNLTPLLDVVLQLITFFMMLIHFGTKIEGESKSIRLPTTPAALPSSEFAIDRLVVAINATGELLADGKSLDATKAASWWAEQASRRRKGQGTVGAPGKELPTLVIVRADKAVPYGVVRKTVAAAQEEGFSHFTLVVIRSRQT